MPIFDFKCRACGETFELIVLGGQTGDCPKCHSTDIEKQASMFKTSVGAPVPTKLQKEQQAIERAGWVKVGQPFKRR